MLKVINRLFLIPARAGSKGIQRKNIKPLYGKPLIQYSIEYAKHFSENSHICISTNDDDIILLAESLGVKVDFKRPEELSSDTSSANDVIKNALDFYKKKGLLFNSVVYLQPTSPFRLIKHFEEAYSIYNKEKADMVVSVCESKVNPYFSLFEEDVNGNLKRSKNLPTNIVRRQDVPKTYLYNGSIYIINTESIAKKDLHQLNLVKKYLMDEIYALDIDTEMDWMFAEFLIERNLIRFNKE
jgi:CMP-N,N'-diacetyllegionaminic acid synthase